MSPPPSTQSPYSFSLTKQSLSVWIIIYHLFYAIRHHVASLKFRSNQLFPEYDRGSPWHYYYYIHRNTHTTELIIISSSFVCFLFVCFSFSLKIKRCTKLCKSPRFHQKSLRIEIKSLIVRCLGGQQSGAKWTTKLKTKVNQNNPSFPSLLTPIYSFQPTASNMTSRFEI